MPHISTDTLMIAIQSVHAEISQIKASVQGNIDDLEADAQEILFALSQAQSEMKQAYMQECAVKPQLPEYQHLLAPMSI
ncbi:hypothetical protein V8J88_06675 [Massilia sp. W12]|uniref:hypothetical protein n=1 Tax=Massilia sp. W12 TaxID=3126507 RepID=UPI0030D42405